MADFDQIRDVVLELLEPYGVRRIALFGSVARGEEEETSDIDILVTFERPFRKPLGMLRLVGMERELAERLGREVDLISEEGLSPYIRPYIEEDEVVLYESQSWRYQSGEAKCSAPPVGAHLYEIRESRCVLEP